MKKICFALLGVLSIAGLASCGGEDGSSHVCEPSISITESISISEIDLTPAPEVNGKIVDWIPNSTEAVVTATLDIKKAPADSLRIICGSRVLKADVDFELDGTELKIFGSFLDAHCSVLGKYDFEIITDHGVTTLPVNVVNSPEGTTIPTKTIQGINMSKMVDYRPTTVIADAPALLISEIIIGAGEYSYVEVFNNTSSTYNLKGHRIVLGYADDENKSSLLISDGILENAVGAATSAYIYQDYEIPALSSALIWVVGSSPWRTATSKENPNITHIITESADVASHIFGNEAENLSVDKFKRTLGITGDALVFPVRCQYSLMNGNNNWNSETGLGTILTKGSGQFGGFSASVKRIVQIQKIDQETKFTENMPEAPAGSAYYRYEMDVINREEDVYVNGVLDHSKITIAGKRESVNGLIYRKVFYNASDEKVGYSMDNTKNLDLYNYYTVTDGKALGEVFRTAAKDSMKPIVSAFIYPNLVTEEGVTAGKNWSAMTSLEYTIPAANSLFMRFIAREDGADYSVVYTENIAFKDLQLSNIVPAITETKAQDIVVPVDAAYSTAYLTAYTNSVNKTGWFNFHTTKPQ